MIALLKICALAIGLVALIGWLSFSEVKHDWLVQVGAILVALILGLIVNGADETSEFFRSIFLASIVLFAITWVIYKWFGAPVTEFFRPAYFVFAMLMSKVVVGLISFRDLMRLPLLPATRRNLMLLKALLERGSEAAPRLYYHSRNRYRGWREPARAFKARLVAFSGTFFYLLGEGDDIETILRNRSVGEWREL